MKRLLTLVFALLAVFTLMGCEGETIIEERIEVVEVERIVIETVTEKLTDEQIATMEEVIEIKLDKKYKEEYHALNEELEKQFDEELQKAIDELEPEIIYETIVKTEIEYVDRVEIQKVYVNKDMGEYTDQEYLALKEELENEIDTLSGLVEDKNLEIEQLESDLVDVQENLDILTQNYIDLWREYEYHRAITEDEIKPVLEWALFQNDEVGNLVLTVHASDNIGMKSLEVDHSMPNIPEFTLYTEDVPASEETFGASVVYLNGVWTINFGETMTTAIREYATVTFYFVAKDLANNTSGTMYYVQPEMTFTFDVPVFEEVPS